MQIVVTLVKTILDDLIRPTGRAEIATGIHNGGNYIVT